MLTNCTRRYVILCSPSPIVLATLGDEYLLVFVSTTSLSNALYDTTRFLLPEIVLCGKNCNGVLYAVLEPFVFFQ